MSTRQLLYAVITLSTLLTFSGLATAQYSSADAEMLKLLAQDEQDIQDLMNQIRRDKFDVILPQIMREHKIDMWIHVLRESNPEFIREDFWSHSRVFIFTDRGGDRIERAVFGQQLSDVVRASGAYDIIPEEVSLREMPGSEETELDRRFIDVGQFVAERDPKRIGVNYLDKLGLPVGN